MEDILSNKNRFDLEEAIMDTWQTADDINLIAERYFDGYPPLNEDELSNALIGLKIIHDFRNEKLFSIFEDLVRTKQFIDTETYVKKEEKDVEL